MGLFPETPRYVRVQQGSEEWYELRRGRITASEAVVCLRKPDSRTRLQYQHQIAMDLKGIDTKPDLGRWAEPMKAREPVALAEYERITGERVWHDVLFIHPDHDWLACSPDGVRSDRRGLECKVRLHPDTWTKAVKRERPEKPYWVQMQFAMLVTGFEEWDYMNYGLIGEKPLVNIKTIERDDDFCIELFHACREFYISCGGKP